KFDREVSKSTGSKMPRADWNTIANHISYIPSTTEQEKISRLFSLLNKKILEQKEKVELLKEQKKGYMQKIFNRELRFKDENSNEFPNWNKTRLDKILTERKSYHIKSNEIPHATLSTEGIYLKTERYDRDFL